MLLSLYNTDLHPAEAINSAATKAIIPKYAASVSLISQQQKTKATIRKTANIIQGIQKISLTPPVEIRNTLCIPNAPATRQPVTAGENLFLKGKIKIRQAIHSASAV